MLRRLDTRESPHIREEGPHKWENIAYSYANWYHFHMGPDEIQEVSQLWEESGCTLLHEHGCRVQTLSTPIDIIFIWDLMKFKRDLSYEKSREKSQDAHSYMSTGAEFYFSQLHPPPHKFYVTCSCSCASIYKVSDVIVGRELKSCAPLVWRLPFKSVSFSREKVEIVENSVNGWIHLFYPCLVSHSKWFKVLLFRSSANVLYFIKHIKLLNWLLYPTSLSHSSCSSPLHFFQEECKYRFFLYTIIISSTYLTFTLQYYILAIDLNLPSTILC